jgi:hypothetical protein
VYNEGGDEICVRKVRACCCHLSRQRNALILRVCGGRRYEMSMQ